MTNILQYLSKCTINQLVIKFNEHSEFTKSGMLVSYQTAFKKLRFNLSIKNRRIYIQSHHHYKMTSSQESSESLSQLSSDDLCQMEHTTRCQSVDACECIKNVIGTLIFYNKNKHELTEDVLADYFLHRCKSLINDYHHILTHHLGGDTKTNNIQFQLIHKQISHYIKCDISKCQQYKRIQTNDKALLNQVLNEYSPITAWIEFTDSIHCYFIHSFDVGYRISPQDQQLIRHNDLNEEQTCDEGSELDVTEITHLRRFLDDKRQKFNTTIVSQNNKYSKFSAGEAQYISSDRDLTLQTSNIRQTAHNFGNRFYYWPYFKTNDIPDPWNPGYRYSELYIPTKYDNLKDEILFNETQPLHMVQYYSLKQKSRMLWHQANSIKSMKCDATRFESTYNIKKGSSVSIAHIIALLLHVNYLNLSPVTNQTNSVLKKRNSQFGHSFRLLRETVECFSLQTTETKIELYRGINGRNPQHNIPMLCQPTSTSRQVEVASLFSEKNGIIIKLSKYSDNLKYFDCSFLSCHGNESEYLVMQSEYESVVTDIQDFKLGLKMMFLSEALIMFDHIFSSYAQNIHHTIPQHLQ
eukprot:479693_1